MPALILALSFTNLASDTYDFVANDHQRVTRFAGSLAPRGSNTGRMQMHGYNPRRTLFEGLVVAHEGLFLAQTSAELVAEKDAMLAILLGDLSAPPTDAKLGVLTAQLAGQTEPASADVTIDSWSWDLSKDSVKTAPYMISWRAFTPNFSTSGGAKVYF